MRKNLLAGLCVFATCFCTLYAQNKTLGVGVTTPNPNAALHVESPTGNQGFIMPRLTTAQRSAMTSLLTDTDKGLMLFDTELNTVFIWNGLSWQGTGEVAGGLKLSYPYKDSVATATGATDLFALKYNNDEPKRVFRVENHGLNNGSSTLSVFNAGSGLGGYFQVSNPATMSSTLMATTNSNAGGNLAPVAVYGESTGTGSLAASFRISNPSNAYPALFAETNGLGRVATFNKIGTEGTEPAIFVNSQGGHGVWADHNGLTGYAAVLQSINPENTDAGMLVEAVGTGASVWALKSTDAIDGDALLAENWLPRGGAARFVQTDANNPVPTVVATTAGQGSAGFFEQTNPTALSPAVVARTDAQSAALNVVSTANSTNANAAEFTVENTQNPGNAIMAVTQGIGTAASFSINNPSNGAPTVSATTNGTGPAVNAENTAAADGFAGSFHNTNPANNYPAIQASTQGFGPGVRVVQDTGIGRGMDVFMYNATSTSSGLEITNNGLGSSARFFTNSPSNTFSGLIVSTIGTGPGGAFQIDNTSSTNSAVEGLARNSGGGAGSFEIYHAANPNAAVFGGTNGTGYAIHARHTGQSGDAIYGEHTGGAGSAGVFRISNGLNTASSVFATTGAIDGTAIGASNEANGVAFAILSGGIQVTTHVVTLPSITVRAAAYQITVAGPITLDFGPKDGEVFMVYNDFFQDVTVAGILIPTGQGKTLIVFPGGNIRGF